MSEEIDLSGLDLAVDTLRGNAPQFTAREYAAMLQRAEAAEARVKLLESFAEFVYGAPVSSGVCCCGDDMEGHTLQEHSPVDMWDNALVGWREQLYPNDGV